MGEILEGSFTSTEQAPSTEQAAPAINEADLGKLSEQELMDFAVSGKVPERKTADPEPKLIPETPAPEAHAAAPKLIEEPAAQPTDEEVWANVDVGDGKPRKFKSKDEFLRSYVHAQKHIASQKEAIDRFNAERSEMGSLRGKLDEAAKEIDTLRRNTQPARMQQPLTQQQSDVRNDLAALQAGVQQVRQGGVPNQAVSNALQANPDMSPTDAIMAEFRKLQNDFQEVKHSLTAKQREAEVGAQLSNLYSEVSRVQDRLTKSGDVEFSTSVPFEHIDDIVSSARGSTNEEVMSDILSKVSESDYNAYRKLTEVIGLVHPVEESGIRLDKKILNGLDEAVLLYRHRNGSLGQTTATAVAEAQKRGAQAYEKAISAGRDAARTLPPSAPASPNDMTAQMVTDIFDQASRDPYGTKNNPARWRNFVNACKVAGVPDPEMALGIKPM
jgi:hypothetical protein